MRPDAQDWWLMFWWYVSGAIAGFGLGLLFVAILVASTTAEGAAPDITLLRDVICHYETRHLNDPDGLDAVSHANAVGRCQILPSTAHDLGYDWRRLDEPEYSRGVALEKLRQCGGTVYAHAYCYNPSHAYAKTVAVLYAEAVRRRQWEVIDLQRRHGL